MHHGEKCTNTKGVSKYEFISAARGAGYGFGPLYTVQFPARYRKRFSISCKILYSFRKGKVFIVIRWQMWRWWRRRWCTRTMSGESPWWMRTLETRVINRTLDEGIGKGGKRTIEEKKKKDQRESMGLR